MWLSLVERCVRDAEVVGSNPAIPTIRLMTEGRSQTGLPCLPGRRWVLQSLLDTVGYGLCHQLPERSLFGGGVRVPVCARDMGIYLGFTIALALLVLVHRDRPSSAPSIPVNVLLALGVAAMAVDGFTSYAGLRTTTNEIRLLTGLATGFALAAWSTPLLNSELWRRGGSGRVLGGGRRVAAYVAAFAGSYVAIWYGAPRLGIVFPLATTASIIVTFTAVNLVIVCLLPPFGRRADHLRDAWLQLLLALGLTAVELALSALLKWWLVGAVVA